MIYFTLSVAGTPDSARREAIDTVMRSHGGGATWRVSLATRRSYALLAATSGFDSGSIPVAPEDSLYAAAIIALAVFPGMLEALPFLREALGGVGAPAGVLACRPLPEGIIVEWDPAVCGAGIVLKLIDLELARFASSRRAELLSPLPPSVVARIASDGLQAPEITTDRVLELLIER